MDILQELDDALHAIASDKENPSDDSKAHKKHERDGHLPKDPACPACVRESGSRVLHYKICNKNHEPHFDTLYMHLEKMNKPDYFGREYYLVAELRIRLEDNFGALLPGFVPIESTAQVPVADAVFQVVNQIFQCKQLCQYEGSIVRRIFSDGKHVFDNPIFRKRALDLEIGVYKTPCGMSKMLVKRLLKSSKLKTFYWNYAVAHAADLLRHRALKMTYPNPAFGKNVGIYTSQDKNKAKALEP
eukprot:4381551-Amphidinium_carterae.1